MVNRIFVSKIEALDVESTHLFHQFTEFLKVEGLKSVKLYNGYDIEGLDSEALQIAINSIFSEPNCDVVQNQVTLKATEQILVYKLLPGQFDQRADSAKQCIEILQLSENSTVQTFKAVTLEGTLSEEDFNRIRKYLINPVEAVEIPVACPLSIAVVLPEAEAVPTYNGFTELDEMGLKSFLEAHGLAMNLEDLQLVQKYFAEDAHRNPTETEIKVLDTYWSDHCRHTTFTTHLTDISFEKGNIPEYDEALQSAYNEYLEMRQFVYGDRAATRPMTLMDLATINAKYEKKNGRLNDLEESDEINAATFEMNVELENGGTEPYLILFKNETHNHPTEIEPFGGAATCLGGAIRDPLSGRSLVYQGMRITGAADPRASLEETLSGKLPQRVITRSAARGFSSYGNQIGLATGYVREYYHSGFLAKRMEVGAVVGAAPKAQVKRLKPETGDIIVLIGGRTGIDGCGGATGSSKAHDEKSLATCASEVQRGNAPEERKLQRLFSNAAFAELIKKSNDFGAGGVSVAIGELADSLDIQLDAIKTKYEGLNGTQLAISESQERMAVVVAPQDAQRVIELATAENLDAYEVAQVTDSGYLRMTWKGSDILCLKRDFIETNGAAREQAVVLEGIQTPLEFEKNSLGGAISQAISETHIKETFQTMASDLNYCSQEGLVEMFDNSIGAHSVFMPYGGRRQKSPMQAMVAKIPGFGEAVHTATVMAAGYEPSLQSQDAFTGSSYAVIEAISKVVAAGGNLAQMKFSMQEYFERLYAEPKKWQLPFKALLGANTVLKHFELSAIGGKDSMSGSFKDLKVPPTLIAFGISTTPARRAVSTEFKQAKEKLVLLSTNTDALGLPNLAELKTKLEAFEALTVKSQVTAAAVVEQGGLLGTCFKMALGNAIGFELQENHVIKALEAHRGSICFTVSSDVSAEQLSDLGFEVIGQTLETYEAVVGQTIVALESIEQAYELPLEEIFPKLSSSQTETLVAGTTKQYDQKISAPYVHKGLKPTVFIPVFPGTNCEWDTAKAFEKAGASVITKVFRNRNTKDIQDSLNDFAKALDQSHILAFPGGFSAGDEPDGSGKFISNIFRNPELAESVMKLLKQRDGLAIGICNGFQALVKLGLVTYGDIRTLEADAPTLTYNTCNKHISKIVSIQTVNTSSPWLQLAHPEQAYTVPLSHGEGRFFCDEKNYETLKSNNQIATLYTAGSNLNGSMYNIEGLVSPDGRIFGKMGHAERIGNEVYRNVPGVYDMRIFESGIKSFK